MVETGLQDLQSNQGLVSNLADKLLLNTSVKKTLVMNTKNYMSVNVISVSCQLKP